MPRQTIEFLPFKRSSFLDKYMCVFWTFIPLVTKLKVLLKYFRKSNIQWKNSFFVCISLNSYFYIGSSNSTMKTWKMIFLLFTGYKTNIYNHCLFSFVFCLSMCATKVIKYVIFWEYSCTKLLRVHWKFGTQVYVDL